jgi:hypothetical protein
MGQISATGKVELSMVEPGNVVDATWADIGELLDPAAEHGIRLVVLQFTMPPPDKVYDPVTVTPSALGGLLVGSIDAVLYTRFPVHYKQYSHFNVKFYSELGKGASVEAAVQVARQALQQNKLIEDAAGFGWFTLVTGPRSDIRLMRSYGKSPQEMVIQKNAPIDSSATAAPTMAVSNEPQYRG